MDPREIDALVQRLAVDPYDDQTRRDSDRMATLYREHGERQELAELLEKQVAALAPMAERDSEIRARLAVLHEEIGQLWIEPPLSIAVHSADHAAKHFRRALELAPSSMFAAFHLREIYKKAGMWSEALPLYAAEIAFEKEPARIVALRRDEAITRRHANDFSGAIGALHHARQYDDKEPGLQYEYAAAVVDCVQSGAAITDQERTIATELLVGLAEMYDGEYGYSYAMGALGLDPKHVRARELATYHARHKGAAVEVDGTLEAELLSSSALIEDLEDEL